MWFLLDRKFAETTRVRTREGQEVELESYGQLQQDGSCNERCRNALVAGCPHGTIASGGECSGSYGIEKSSVSRQFVAASSNQLRCCANDLRRSESVVLMSMAFTLAARCSGGSGIAEGGEKHVLGVWQGATENTAVVKGLLEDLVDRGLDRQRRSVVMDGSKALRAGVEHVFGEQWKCSAARFTNGGM